MIEKGNIYLVIKILQIHAQDAIQDYGDPEIWATVNWGGSIRQTKKIKSSQLNETFHFQLNISDKQIKKSSSGEIVDLYL